MSSEISISKYGCHPRFPSVSMGAIRDFQSVRRERGEWRKGGWGRGGEGEGRERRGRGGERRKGRGGK